MNKCKNVFLFVLIGSFICLGYMPVFSQSFEDTIYYNENNFICEKPVAVSYRVCTLHKENIICFIGPFQDFTINHTLIARGAYDYKGRKTGLFEYYYPGGSIRCQGYFTDDEMDGIWYYYKPEGGWYFVNKYTNSSEATPVYIGEENTVLLNNGNGSFIISTSDYPDVFGKRKMIIEGNCEQGNKTGEWNYFAQNMSFKMATENYVSGTFETGESYSGEYRTLRKPYLSAYLKISYVPEETAVKETFFSSAIFGDLRKPENEQRLIRYLIAGITPEIKVYSTSYNNNLPYFSRVFLEVLTPDVFTFSIDLKKDISSELRIATFYKAVSSQADATDLNYFRRKTKNKTGYLYNYKLFHLISDRQLYNSIDAGVPVELHCRFYITDTGTIRDLTLEGNLSNPIKQQVRYYFSRLKGLQPSPDHQYTNLYLYSVPHKGGRIEGSDFFVSYFNRLQYH